MPNIAKQTYSSSSSKTCGHLSSAEQKAALIFINYEEMSTDTPEEFQFVLWS